MKIYKIPTAALVLGLVNTAIAWIYWVLGLIVAVGAAIVIYKLFTIARIINPENPPNELFPQANGEWVEVIPTIIIVPPIVPFTIKSPPNKTLLVTNVAENTRIVKPALLVTSVAEDKLTPPAFSMSMTYGVTYGDQKPWINTNGYVRGYTNLPPPLVLTDTAEAYAFAITFDGQWWLCSYTNNDTTINQLAEPPDSATNYYRKVTVVRSLDLLSRVWVPLFTDEKCPVNSIRTFCDSNAPPDHAFYRTVIP